jgi:hypothetical protein
VSLSQRIVARLEEACRARGVTLIVLLHPNRRAFQGDAALLEPFQHAPRGLGPGTRVIDLRAAYARAGIAWEDLALDKLGHLTPRGNRLVADVLAEALGR